MEFCKILNKGTTPFVVNYNASKFIVKPGSEEVVPWASVTSLLGDPNLRDLPKCPDRRDCFRQVRAMFNFYEGFDDEDTWNVGWIDSKGHPQPAKKPPVEVYSMDGQRIYMVIDDPEGVMQNPFSSQEEPPEVRVMRLEQSIEELKSMLAQALGNVPMQSALPTVTPTVIPPEIETLPSITGSLVVEPGVENQRAPFVDGDTMNFPDPPDNSGATLDRTLIQT
jgi:hypothetical protein